MYTYIQKPGRSESSKRFISWMDGFRTRQKLTLDETAEKIGVSRKTLCTWRRQPSIMKKVELAGIAYIFGYDCGDFEDLCKEFKVVTKNKKCDKKI